MKSFVASLALVAGVIPASSAHYVFTKLIVDGETSSDYQYIRKNTNTYMPTKGDDILANDFRCNQGSFDSAASTEVAEVAAGSEIGMQLGYSAAMEHPGPLSVYMSKASSGDVTTYEGDGDWFKIYQTLVCNDSTDGLEDEDWCTWGKDTETFTIPSEVEDGEYLVRIEHIGLHGAMDGNAEFFYTCAQVKVTGGGSGSMSPTTKIPGVYATDDEAINFNIWSNPTEYSVFPGIAVAEGGETVGSSNGVGGTATAENAGTTSSDSGSESGSSSSSTLAQSQTTLATAVRTSSSTASASAATTTVADNNALTSTTSSPVATGVLAGASSAAAVQPSSSGRPSRGHGRKGKCSSVFPEATGSATRR